MKTARNVFQAAIAATAVGEIAQAVAPITATRFYSATGVEPEQDDLERSNCLLAGEIGHLSCGWDRHRNLPRFYPA